LLISVVIFVGNLLYGIHTINRTSFHLHCQKIDSNFQDYRSIHYLSDVYSAFIEPILIHHLVLTVWYNSSKLSEVFQIVTWYSFFQFSWHHLRYLSNFQLSPYKGPRLLQQLNHLYSSFIVECHSMKKLKHLLIIYCWPKLNEYDFS
jgi:hypothetical protein